MRLFKATYKDKKGNTRKTKKWYLDFPDHLDRRHKMALFTHKRASKEFKERLSKLITIRMSGDQVLSVDLQRWIEGLPERFTKKLVKWGLLDSHRATAGKPLSEHLEDFKQSLIAKGNTEKHANLMYYRANKTLEECNFIYFKDISLSRVENYLSDLRKGKKKKKGISAQTFNFYVQAVKQFCNFMVKDRRVTENPLKYLQKVNVKPHLRYKRRALEPDEIRELLEATESAEEIYGVSGHDRAVLYRLAVETGLRASELDSLTVDSFDFKNNTVTVEAGYSKNRKEATLPLRKRTAAILQYYLSNKLPKAKAIKMPRVKNLAKMLRKDLKRVDINRKDKDGKIIDFHSLRHSFATMLANSGVNPKTAQELMRHSDINLTMSRYTHTLRGQTAKAVSELPDLDQPSKKNKQKATGTCDKKENCQSFNLDVSLDKIYTIQCNSFRNNANLQNEISKAGKIKNAPKDSLDRREWHSKIYNGGGGIRTRGAESEAALRFSKPAP